MKKVLMAMTVFMSAVLTGMAQKMPAKLGNESVINLYDKVEKSGVEEKTIMMGDNAAIVNVSNPTMTVYLPDKSKDNGSTMLVCPGGGFLMLSWDTEGTLVAKELVKRGFTVFLLKYRLNPMLKDNGKSVDNGTEVGLGVMKFIMGDKKDPKEIANGEGPLMSDRALNTPGTQLAMADATQAMTLIKGNAKKWGLNPDKVGIMGFSAGSLISMYIAQNHTESSRPAFVGAIYTGWTPDVKAPEDAAPLFLCSPVNDVFTPDEQLNIYKAWRLAKKPVEVHNYWKAEHGYGATHTGNSVDNWIDQMCDFMKDVDLIK